MVQYSWHEEYLAALVASDVERTARFETTKFLASIASEDRNGVYELLLHRTVAQLDSTEDAINLLLIASDAGWVSYAPRILARITDLDGARKQYPSYVEYINEALQTEALFTTYSVRDWHIVTNDVSLKYDKNSAWSRQLVDIQDIVDKQRPEPFAVDDVVRVLNYCFEVNIRVFQIAIAAFTTQDPNWANILHKALSAPYINVRVAPARGLDENVQYPPPVPWAPNWVLFMDGLRRNNWRVYERHTQVGMPGQGSKGLREQLTILFSLSGLLRDCLMLAPVGDRTLFVQRSHPIWGFGDRQFNAGGSGYHDYDIRALALAFLEHLPETTLVNEFRSRLALHFLNANWRQRRSALALTADDGFFSNMLQIAKHFTANDFETSLERIDSSAFTTDPLLQYLRREAASASSLVGELRNLPADYKTPDVAYPAGILCVAHASEPHQNGGYAVRAHGILKHLKEQNVNISAVTRPGFPDGARTEETTEIVENVEYLRIPATDVSRESGEIQHMLSYVEPFQRIFAEKGVGIIHVRSTYLIALPALIAARRLGLKVLYEVSGLWDLVYQDSEDKSQPLKRSAFPLFAESLVMSAADQVVVMNEALREIALDRGADPNALRIAHNAVDTDVFQPLEKPHNSIFTIGYLGSFVSYEGIGRLIDVVKLLHEQDVPVRLLAVGDGIRRKPLLKRIENEELADSVDMPGRVPHQEVIDYYRQMDVVIYPRVSTGTTEAITPLKPFEALALAKPIIVSDVAPLREIVGENERGLIFENGSVTDLASRIRQLMDDPGLSQELAHAGREWVVENRNWENVVRIFVDVYAQLS